MTYGTPHEGYSCYSGLDEMDVQQKLDALREALGGLDSLMVAYSGGTDSAYLAYEAHRVLGEQMLAVIADSPSLPRRELAAALDFAAQHGIPVHILQTRELDDPKYARNDGERCFTARTNCSPRWRPCGRSLALHRLRMAGTWTTTAICGPDRGLPQCTRRWPR